MKQSSFSVFDLALSRQRQPHRPVSATWGILALLVILGVLAALAQANMMPKFSADDPTSLLFNGG